MWLFDQVFSGFDPALPEGGVGAFIQARKPVLGRPEVTYALEFPEFAFDTYENLVACPADLSSAAHRNNCLWRDPRQPGSMRYGSLAEFAGLIRALRERGVPHIFARTFLPFEGRTGQGRFLRWENSPHTHAFEWRRADEFCRRHPEVRDPRDHLLNWDAPLRPDPLYGIGPDTTVGQWFTKRLFDLLETVGFNGLRLGDGSYGGSLNRGQPDRVAMIRRMHRDLHAAAKARGMVLMTSLGPYWTFDAWSPELEVPFEALPETGDLILTQPLECWTDRYGLTYTHNGEYFSAGSAQVHALVNAAQVPDAPFVRGLDAGDPIENWHVPEGMPLRETGMAMTLWTRHQQKLQSAHVGVYPFWSDELSANYYRDQATILGLVQAHPPAVVLGPCLAVTSGERPHVYSMADFFECGGYGLAQSARADQLVPQKGALNVFFLPRREGSPAMLDETLRPAHEQRVFDELMQGPGTLLVFGGAQDAEFLEAFGVRVVEGPFHPVAWNVDGEEGLWADRAEWIAAPGMAGRPEKFIRRDQLNFQATDAVVLASARDGQGGERVLACLRAKPGGGANILVCGLPAEPVAISLTPEQPFSPVPLYVGSCAWADPTLVMPPQSQAWFELSAPGSGNHTRA